MAEMVTELRSRVAGLPAIHIAWQLCYGFLLVNPHTAHSGDNKGEGVIYSKMFIAGGLDHFLRGLSVCP